ncbi:GNAT family N-acetyltransferase [Nonomuraea sp. B5E05]|uniref:GNAT family N-acetyltransferase n=1 Tax=Nonomuraea sp. B5E05 TaxID=3153569 RepID=UPI0032605E68
MSQPQPTGNTGFVVAQAATTSQPESAGIVGDIRRLTIDDLSQCLKLAQDRDWPAEEHKWRLLLEIGDVYGIDDPDASERDPAGRLAGTVISTPYGTQLTFISMVLVAKRHQRRGIGGRMMRHALRHSGTDAARLTATPYGRHLYARLGFRGVGTVSTFTGIPARTMANVGEAASRLATPADLPAIAALDQVAFGAPRTSLVSALPSFCSSLRVVQGPSGIAGYGGAWKSLDRTTIGPVIADDIAAARTLIADLAADVPGTIRVDIDERHAGLISWVEQHGLTHTYDSEVMAYGPARADRPDWVFAMAAQALG